MAVVSHQIIRPSGQFLSKKIKLKITGTFGNLDRQCREMFGEPYSNCQKLVAKNKSSSHVVPLLHSSVFWGSDKTVAEFCLYNFFPPVVVKNGDRRQSR